MVLQCSRVIKCARRLYSYYNYVVPQIHLIPSHPFGLEVRCYWRLLQGLLVWSGHISSLRMQHFPPRPLFWTGEAPNSWVLLVKGAAPFVKLLQIDIGVIRHGQQIKCLGKATITAI